jgi:hypothetical protein
MGYMYLPTYPQSGSGIRGCQSTGIWLRICCQRQSLVNLADCEVTVAYSSPVRRFILEQPRGAVHGYFPLHGGAVRCWEEQPVSTIIKIITINSKR